MVARQTHTYFDRELRPLGLGFVHGRMLGFLFRHGGSHIMQEDVRAYIGQDKGSVAHSIKRLVDEGYITRTAHPEDGRAYEIHLTEKAEAFRAEWERIVENWSAQLVDGFSDEEKEYTAGMLKRMLGNACSALEPHEEGCGCGRGACR